MRGKGSNQRDFYRVECRAVLDYVALGDHLPAARSAESFFGDGEHFALLRELRKLDHDNAQLLHAIGESDRNVGSYLHLLNRKIDLLARHIAALSPGLKSGSEQTISLSEGGLSFAAADPPAAGSVLALRMTLLPAYAVLALFASVVKLQPLADGQVQVSLNFERLQDAERQAIARHVMQVQMAEQRRKAGRE
jgi:hypothetical protein